MPKWFPCCSSLDCTFFADSLSRASGTPGTDWDSRSGTWTIGNWGGTQRLLGSGAANGLIVGTTPYTAYTGDDEPVVFQTTVLARDWGAKPRLVLSGTDDNTYAYVEFELGPSTSTLRIVDRVSSSDTVLDSVGATGFRLDTPIVLKACLSIDPIGVTALASSSFGASANASGEPLSEWSENYGCGTGNTLPVAFSDYGVYYHEQVKANCWRCCDYDAPACSAAVPQEIQVDVAGFGGAAAALNGSYVVSQRCSYTQVGGRTGHWRYAFASTTAGANYLHLTINYFWPMRRIDAIFSPVDILEAGIGNRVAAWSDTKSTALDCHAFSSLPLYGWLAGTTYSMTGATCVLTTL